MQHIGLAQNESIAKLRVAVLDLCIQGSISEIINIPHPALQGYIRGMRHTPLFAKAPQSRPLLKLDKPNPPC